jgi:hypothetical protein
MVRLVAAGGLFQLPVISVFFKYPFQNPGRAVSFPRREFSRLVARAGSVYPV